MHTSSEASDIIIVPPPEENRGEKVELLMREHRWRMVICLAEDLEQSRLAASPADFNSANHTRLVGHP